MPKLRSLLPAMVVLLFVAAAHTQGTTAQSERNVGTGVGAGNGSGTASSTAVREARSGLMVSGVAAGFTGPFNGTKGQPFSADAIDEIDQFLADGNHIHRESHGKLFRDSEGPHAN